MKKLFSPAGILFSLMSLLLFFLIGIFVADALEVAKGQGLAGGAIVLMYGFLFALAALIGSFFVTYTADKKLVTKGNWILLVALLVCISVVYWKVQQSNRDQIDEELPSTVPTKPTAHSVLIEFRNG